MKIARIAILGIQISLFSCISLHASDSTRSDFLFQLSTALKTHNKDAVEKCFNLSGVDESTRGAILRVIAQICAWPSPYISSSERSGSGPLIQNRDGRSYSLNGEWMFQVHIHKAKPPSKGYVLPAGRTASGEYAILLSVAQ